MKSVSSENLTTPDLVLLSLLAERAMHGYQANALLEFRKVRDWAGVSRPQIYYSLEKLARLGLIASAETDQTAGGPERRVFETTTRGRAALADALERKDWTQQMERPPFLTWLAHGNAAPEFSRSSSRKGRISWSSNSGIDARSSVLFEKK
jgi:DNA-binding PadR family transcriptional regulator